MPLTIVLDVGSRTSIRKSKPADYPSPLRNRLKGYQQVNAQDIETRPTINETCPVCGRKEVKYTNLQLRSADEGTTTFFFCDCGNR